MSAPAVRNDRDALGLEISNFGAQALLPHQGSVSRQAGLAPRWPYPVRSRRAIPQGAARAGRPAVRSSAGRSPGRTSTSIERRELTRRIRRPRQASEGLQAPGCDGTPGADTGEPAPPRASRPENLRAGPRCRGAARPLRVEPLETSSRTRAGRRRRQAARRCAADPRCRLRTAPSPRRTSRAGEWRTTGSAAGCKRRPRRTRTRRHCPYADRPATWRPRSTCTTRRSLQPPGTSRSRTRRGAFRARPPGTAAGRRSGRSRTADDRTSRRGYRGDTVAD